MSRQYCDKIFLTVPERDSINRKIIRRNMMSEQARAMLELAKQEVRSIQHSKIRDVTVSVKNEVIEMIAKVAERKDRQDIPIDKGKYEKLCWKYGCNRGILLAIQIRV